jgi:hypothetical protein
MIRETVRTPVADLRSRAGETVTVCGWVQALRLQRAMQFVVVRDHTGAVQVTHRRAGDLLETVLDGLTPESAVRITGRVVANQAVSLGGLERGARTGGFSTCGGAPPRGWCWRCRTPSSGRYAPSPAPRTAPRCTRPS